VLSPSLGERLDPFDIKSQYAARRQQPQQLQKNIQYWSARIEHNRESGTAHSAPILPILYDLFDNFYQFQWSDSMIAQHYWCCLHLLPGQPSVRGFMASTDSQASFPLMPTNTWIIEA
jgi:hypothetical protein